MSTRFVLGASAIYLAVMAVERLCVIAMFPLMTRVLSPADYGVILLISNGTAWLTMIVGFSLAHAIPGLIGNAQSQAERYAIFTTLLSAIVLLLALAYGLVALNAQGLSRYFLGTADYAGTLALGALASFLAGSIAVGAAILRLTEQHVLYARVQIPALLLQTGLIAWLLLATSLGVNSPFAAMATVGLVLAAIYVRILRPNLRGPIDTAWLQRAGRIAMQMLPWQLATVLTTSSAGFFLTRQGYLEDAGLFMVASAMAAMVATLSAGFENAWTPFVLLRKGTTGLPDLQARMFGIYSSIMLVGAAAASLFAHEIFVMLAGPAFRQGYKLVPPLVLAYCLFGFANAFSQGLQARQSTKHYAWIGGSGRDRVSGHGRPNGTSLWRDGHGCGDARGMRGHADLRCSWFLSG